MPSLLESSQYHVKVKGENAYRVLSQLAFVFVEYPRDWMTVNDTYVEVTIPQERWESTFKASYNESLSELKQSQVLRTDLFSDGQEQATAEPLMISGSAPGSIRLHPLIGYYVTVQPEPSVASYYLREIMQISL